MATQLAPPSAAHATVEFVGGGVGHAAHVPGGGPQGIVPLGQLHALDAQLPLIGHVLPHMPQFPGSLVKSTHVIPHWL